MLAGPTCAAQCYNSTLSAACADCAAQQAYLLRRKKLPHGLSRRLELTGLRFLLGHRLRRGVPKLLGPRATKCATTDTVASPAVSLASGSTVVANASLQRGGCESLRRQLSLERAPYELREHVWLKDISAGRPRLRCAVPARELAQRRLRQLRGALRRLYRQRMPRRVRR